MTNLSIPEPAPIPNDNESIHDLVMKKLKRLGFNSLIKDIEDRKQFGLEKYGVPLQAGNGRKSLKESFQEVGDAICYIEQEIVEKGTSIELESISIDLIKLGIRIKNLIVKKQLGDK